jgi:hypothetical protein
MNTSADWTIVNKANPTSEQIAGVGPTDKDPKRYRELLQAFMNDIIIESNPKSKKDRLTTNSGFNLLPLTINDSTKVGATVSISPLWLDEYNKGRKNKISYDDVKDLTIIIPKKLLPKRSLVSSRHHLSIYHFRVGML